MPRTGSSTPFTLRLTPAVESALETVATQLGLDRSSTIRFLIMQKARELDATAKPLEPPAPKRAPRGKRKKP
jgi:hypothetical protein